MANELFETLTRFRWEVLLPDVERIVDARITPLRADLLSGFDHMYVRFERLELVQRIDRIESTL